MALTYVRTQTELGKWMQVFAEKLKAQLKKDGTYASGRTANSIEGGAKISGSQIDGFLTAREMYGADGTVLDALDTGIKPKRMPNTSFIIGWMKDRNIRPKKKGAFVRATETNYKKSAFAIAKSIQERGTIKKFSYKGSGILDFTFKSIEGPFVENVLSAYGEDVQEYLDEQIGKDKIR